MTRRVFLSSLAASPAIRTVALPRARITRITLASVQGRFHKFVAMNSYDVAPKGHTYTNTLIRIATDAGVEGIGIMGYAVRDRVEVYDGTLYFSDVWFKDRGVNPVLEEAEEAVKKGYQGLKFKVGRGWKWMPPARGLERDIEVLKAARRAVGPGIRIMADANDGFRNDFEGA